MSLKPLLPGKAQARMAERSLLPSNEIAERALLGGLLAAEENADLADQLRVEDFYFSKHQAIARVIRSLRAEGLKIDLPAVAATLMGKGELERAGGAGYVAGLLDEISGDPAYQLRLVRDAATKRAAVEAGNAIMKAGQDGLAASEVLSKARDLVAGLGVRSEDDPASRPLTPDETRVLGVLTERPEDAEPLISLHGRPLILPRTVNMLTAGGGTGKTRLLIQLILAAVAGLVWAFFQAARPLRVLALFAEEDQDEVDRRLWDACGGRFPEGLYARSVKGIAGPLMHLEGSTPKRSPWFYWLDKTLQNHAPLDLLILDPKSRFYGLDELNNDHATQWVASLEALTIKHQLAILFTHHVPKQTNAISQWMARGGGALVDACRCVIGMVPLDPEVAKRLGIKNPEKTVALNISKINYGPKAGADSYLVFNEDGNLEPINLTKMRSEQIGLALLEILQACGGAYSRRELEKEPAGKPIADELARTFPGFRRRLDLAPAIGFLLKNNLAIESSETTGTNHKLVLRPWSNPDTDNPDKSGHGECVRI